MSTRVQVILKEEERDRFAREAAARGMSLSAWMREAAGEKLRASGEQASLRSVEALRAFFGRCDEREQGVEPDWEEHRGVIEASKGRGVSGT